MLTVPQEMLVLQVIITMETIMEIMMEILK